MKLFFARYETPVKILVFISYAGLRAFTTLAALHAPRELADTIIYAAISLKPILNANFLHVLRPFVFPLLLQITQRDYDQAAALQLTVTILSWGALAFSVSASLRTVSLRLFSFGILLAVSLVRHLAGWDFVMMTESLSLSSFLLFVACGIWLSRGWKFYKVVILSIVAFLFAFTRDTNAYLLLMAAGMLLLAVAFRWAKPQTLTVAGIFLAIFFLNNLSANVSGRWEFPFINVVGKRILPYTDMLQAFQACGMPINDELLSLAGLYANANERQFYEDPALEDFRRWVSADGKTCYMQWLVLNPAQSVSQVWQEFDGLIYFQDVAKYFSRKYVDLLPSRVERVLYPVYFIRWIFGVLTLGAALAIYKKRWRENSLWALFIFLALTIFPHLFITWHGDAMAVERHALSVGLQVALTFWLLIFLGLEETGKCFSVGNAAETLAGSPVDRSEPLNPMLKPNALQKFLHRFLMLKWVSAILALVLYRLDTWISKWTRGRHTLTEIAGLPMIYLTTLGAKTGQPRTMPLVGLWDGEKIALVGSNFGRKPNPGWYYNLKQNPVCEIAHQGSKQKYRARQAEGAERERYWQLAVSYYRGYALYEKRAAHRIIPIMILEPLK
ncbi:MAG: nitroreductase family deazaflavin-dependent oxidoreductase [Anaerolineales bacterium]|nr:nitroreductase family deazaflavin-dependent oxidoreductase [Anaerolineales bacterium]